MQNYQLVAVDQDPCFDGLPAYEKVIAVSMSINLLKEYCVKEFKEQVIESIGEVPIYKMYYYVKPSNIIII